MADFLVSEDVQAGETLTQTKGQKLVEYRNGALLPLNSSGNRETGAVNIGSSSYRWNDAFLTKVRFATNTIYDGNLTGNWAFNSGNLTGIAALTATLTQGNTGVFGASYVNSVTAPSNGIVVQGKIMSGGGSSPTATGAFGSGHLQAETDVYTVISCINHNNSSGNYPVLQLAKSKGTQASPTIVSASDLVASIVGLGYDGANYLVLAEMNAYVDGTPGTNDMPGGWVWKTTADGAASTTNRMWLNNAGRLGVGVSSPDSLLHVFVSSAGTVSATSNSALTLEKTGDLDLQFLTGNTGIQAINFGDVDDNDVGGIRYSHSSNIMDFYRAAGVGMSLDSSGLSTNGGIDAGDTGVYLRFKELEIVNWNMDADSAGPDVTLITGSTDCSKVKMLQVIIRPDSGVTQNHYDLILSDSNNEFKHGSFRIEISGSDVVLKIARRDAGNFDNSNYDQVSGYVRGWVRLWYTV